MPIQMSPLEIADHWSSDSEKLFLTDTVPKILCSVLEFQMMDTVQKTSSLIVIYHCQNPLELILNKKCK
jgi:hypothetical protein